MLSSKPCPEVAHAAITASAVSFAAGTVFQSASGDDRVVLGDCRDCGARLSYPLADWRDEPTEVVDRRTDSPKETKETE